ncbi:Ig-like domain-containing protein [Haladaptatus sp. CMSO5]|uniref:Ig-like domain-containing protein n=1 Tax=Haladaptatus sp. CMSO5 TaxID=3120514 RepID=UPI002FCE38AC
MRLWGDKRGQAIQIGAVLLFATLIIALSLYQATVVPQNNKEVEFNHNLQVQDQLVDMRNAIIRTAGTGTEQPASVTLGTQYAERVFSVNPGRPGGTLETVSLGTISIENAATVGDNPYWETVASHEFETKGLQYRPNYNEYRNAPTTSYEHSILFNQFEDSSNRVLADQSIVNGRQITLITLDGKYQESTTGSVTLNARPVSVSAETVAITNTSTGPVRITLPTRMSEEQWLETLEDQSVADGGFVDLDETTYTPGSPNTITLVLKGDETYNLRLAKVGVGTQVESERATYITTDKPNQTVTPGASERFTVTVKDRYNNPVSGVVVNSSNETKFVPISNTTDQNGKFEFRYTAPTSEQSDTVVASILGNSTNYERVDFTIEVSEESGNGDEGNEINPAEVGDIRLTNSSIAGGSGKNGQTVSFVLENTGDQANITSARISFYYEAGTGSGSADNAVIRETGTSNSATLDIGGEFKTLNPEITLPGSGATTTVDLEFWKNAKQGTNDDFQVKSGDFVVITVTFDSGESATYFIAP